MYAVVNQFDTDHKGEQERKKDKETENEIEEDKKEYEDEVVKLRANKMENVFKQITERLKDPELLTDTE